MADDLAAEIAAHRPYTATKFTATATLHLRRCRECGGAWPCLVWRLLDLLLASEGVLIDAPALVVRENDLRLADERERDALRDGVLRVIREMEGTAKNWGDGPAGQFAGPMLRHVRSLVRALATADGGQPA